MCEVKPGVRCSADTQAVAVVTLGAYVGQYPGGPSVDTLAAANATFIEMNPEAPVQIPDPDDPMGMPIYEGPAKDAAALLEPGRYVAYDLHRQDGPTMHLTVPETPAEPGLRVNHATYGSGTVVQVGQSASGTRVQVEWDNPELNRLSTSAPTWEEAHTLHALTNEPANEPCQECRRTDGHKLGCGQRHTYRATDAQPATVEAVDDYKLKHVAPGNDGYSANARDLNALMPDVYEHPEWYDAEASPRTVELIRAMHRDPNMMVTVYRSAPAGVQQINPGDWVALDEQYARDHGAGMGENGQDWPVMSMQVPAHQLWSEGSSLTEFGWDPS